MKRNRRDHFIPQGYLGGFIDPARRNEQQPLWYLDVPNNKWSERSPREIGYRVGFYDHYIEATGLENADEVFAGLENKFPLLVRKLASTNFAGWREHLDFFLHYMQMMRARSLLFFDQHRQLGKDLRAWTIREVVDERTVRLESLEAQPVSEGFITNRALSEMRAEIDKGPAWLKDFNWALRYCDSPLSPFVVSELPVVLTGAHQHATDSFRDESSLLFFPLCWQACLIGSRQFFHIETSTFGENDMQVTRKMYMDSAEAFVVSPTRL